MPVYWVAYTCFIALLGCVFLDWQNLRQLVPAGLTGLILSGLHIGLPVEYMPVFMTDTGPIAGNVAVTLLLQICAGPIFAMWFAQGLTGNSRTAVIRIVQFAALGTCSFWMGVEAGRATFAPWWGPGAMFLADLGWFGLVWQVHRYCVGRARHSAGDAYDA